MTAPRPGLAPPYRLDLAGTQEDSYLEGTVERLFGLLVEVLKKRQPEIQAVFTTGLDSLDPDRELLLRGLQTQGIWLQLKTPSPANAGGSSYWLGPTRWSAASTGCWRGPPPPASRPRRCAGSWPWRASAR
jgi:hypothetical protein